MNVVYVLLNNPHPIQHNMSRIEECDAFARADVVR